MEIRNMVVIRLMKSASTSLTRFVQRNGRLIAYHGLAGNFLGVHSPYRDIVRYLPMNLEEGEMKDVIFLSAVREPISRAKSAYLHLADKKKYPKPDDWIRDRWLKIPDDEEMLNGLDIPNLKVFVMERINEDAQEWAEEIGLPYPRFVRANTLFQREGSKNKIYPKCEFLPETENAILEKFRWTVENFYGDLN